MRAFQPVSDIDIYRSACRWLDKHGDRAEAAAVLRAAEMLAADDTVGADAWLRISEAIKALRGEPGAA